MEVLLRAGAAWYGRATTAALECSPTPSHACWRCVCACGGWGDHGFHVCAPCLMGACLAVEGRSLSQTPGLRVSALGVCAFPNLVY